MPEFAIPKFFKPDTLEVLRSGMEIPKEYYLSQLFSGDKKSNSDLVTFLMQVFDDGMAPIISKYQQTPKYKGGGFYEMEMKGFRIGQKVDNHQQDIIDAMSDDPDVRQIAEDNLLLDIESLNRRILKRKEWVASQICFRKGEINYTDEEGGELHMDFQLLPDLYVKKTGTQVWLTGTDRKPLTDVEDMKTRISKRTGASVTHVFTTSDTMKKYVASDDKIIDLFKKSNYGFDGSEEILRAKPVDLLSGYLDIPLVIYDHSIRLTINILQRVAADTYVVNDATALTVGTEVLFQKVGSKYKDLSEIGVISAVDLLTNTITMETAASGVYKNGDIMQVSIPFMPEGRFVFLADKVDGRPLLQWRDTPYAILKAGGGFSGGNPGQAFDRKWGVTLDGRDTWDPDSAVTRGQLHGLWTLLHLGIGTLDVV